MIQQEISVIKYTMNNLTVLRVTVILIENVSDYKRHIFNNSEISLLLF